MNAFHLTTTSNVLDLRTRIIESILKMKKLDEAYARAALAHYNKELPWLNLNEGVKDALKGGK